MTARGLARRGATGVLAVVCVAAAAGCVPARGGWDAGRLERSHPALGETRHRLRDLAPHFVPAEGELVLFLCRWATERPVPVVLPPDADPDERAMLRRALAAWAAAGLGLRFREVAATEEGIVIRFVRTGDEGPQPAGAGDTLADCRVRGRPAPGAPPAAPLDARLRLASVLLRRDQPDWLGRPLPLGPDERLGAALHELGHALGFSSHVASGDSVLRSSPEIARRQGAAVRRGEWTGDANVAALYAVPSGVVVGRRPLAAEQASVFARLGSAARAAGMAGPYTRVGDRSARLFYRADGQAPVAIRALPWPSPDGDLRRVALEPNAAARRLLEGASATESHPLRRARGSVAWRSP
jgi:hypothetical protein